MNDNIDHHIFNKDPKQGVNLWSSGKVHFATDFTNIWVNTRFVSKTKIATTRMKTVGSLFWKHEEPVCETLSVERVLAHEMIHVAYRWPTPSKELDTIRLENEIMDDIQYDNYDRLETLYRFCD